MRITTARRGWVLMWVVWASVNGQSTIHLPSQGRQADFSGFPLTKPARTVAALPPSCGAGEIVAVAAGAGAGLYFCNALGAWVAAAPHSHNLNELNGVTGKQGTAGVLQAFGGGAVAAGECAQFDENGNLVSAKAPCSSGASNFGQAFTLQSTVEVAHNLGTMNVLVGCVDDSEQVVTPNSVRVLDANQVEVQFAVPQSGRCVVNASGGGGGGGSAVSSVFGRTGAVTAQAGDYSFAQLGGQLDLSQITPAALQGNGSKLQLFAGAAVAGACAQFDAGGNLTSAGAPCGAGDVAGPAGSADGEVALFSGTGGKTLKRATGDGVARLVNGVLGVVTGSPGDCVKADGSAGPCGAGDVAGPAGSADGEVALFSGTGGKTLKRATGDGVARLINGVLGVVTGSPGDCVKADGSTGPCGGTVYFGGGLAGTGTAADPVRIDPAGGVASQAFYAAAASPGTISAQSCAEFNMAANGASAGDAVVGSWPATLPGGVVGMMYGATNLVVVRLCNVTTAGIAVPDGLTYGARVVRGF